MADENAEGELPTLSRQVLWLLEVAHTIFAYFFQYFASAQDAFLRDVKQYHNDLYNFMVRGTRKGRDFMKKAIFLSAVLLFLLFIAFTVLMGCLLFAMGTTVAFRYYMLRNIPGSHVMPLDFNTMPFYTEWWRNKPIDDAALAHLPLLTQERLAVSSHPDRNESGYMIQYAPKTMESAYAELKFSLLNRYRNSVLATSTMLLSSGPTPEVFLPSGDVNLEAIFHLESPLFNAKAQYYGKMQLVFLREDVGRDVTVVVENTMLLSEDASLPQSLATLDAVFRKYVSLNVHTGMTPAWWPIRIAKYAFQIVFYAPIKGFQIIQRIYIDTITAPFPKVDHDREVAVTVSLYDRFTPPLSLQNRLRAMNITVYQNPDEGSTGSLKRVKLLRMTFYSFLELRGVVGWLVQHPVISFVLLTLLVFIILCAVTFIVCTVLSVTLYRRFKLSALRKGRAFDLGPPQPWSLQKPLMESHRRQRYDSTDEDYTIKPGLLEENELRRFASLPHMDSASFSGGVQPGGQSSKLRKE